jgi:hypothetical protein
MVKSSPCKTANRTGIKPVAIAKNKVLFPEKKSTSFTDLLKKNF